jgi:GPI mannosyltransferase 4
MTLLKWVWPEDDQGHVSPEAIYYSLRVVIFILSFVLADWAIYELVHSPRHRRQAVILIASSYVTWTYQSHTFSNSIETLLVLWSLVLIERIVREKVSCSRGIILAEHYADRLQNHPVGLSCGILAFIIVFGVFNRITFPAFILIPGLQLLPHVLSRQVVLVQDFHSLLTNHLKTIFHF